MPRAPRVAVGLFAVIVVAALVILPGQGFQDLRGDPPAQTVVAGNHLSVLGTARPSSLPTGRRGPSVRPAGIVYEVPVTIQNSQSIATPEPFQQLVTVDSASFAKFEAPNLQNVEFLGGNGNVLPSWLESGNNSSSSQSLYWVKLVTGIPADSSVTIYLAFAAPSTSLFNDLTTGEAPQLSAGASPGLSSTYGIYDDGATVFPVYQNFANVNPPYPSDSPVIPPGWYTSGTGGSCSYVFANSKNGLFLSGVNGCGAVYLGSNISVNPSVTVDEQLTMYQATGTDWQAPLVLSSSNSSYSPLSQAAVEWSDNNAACNSVNTAATLGVTAGPGGSMLQSLGSPSLSFVLSLSSSAVSLNYTAVYSPAGGVYTTSGYLALSVFTSSSCGSSILGWWVRERATPPNGVMPTAVVNATSPGLSSVSISPAAPAVAPDGAVDLLAGADCGGALCPAGVTYGWALSNTLGSLNTSTGSAVRFTAGPTAGTTQVTVTATLNGNAQSSSEVVTIVPELAAVTVTPSSGSVLTGGHLQLTAATSCLGGACPSGVSYTWLVNNSLGSLNTTTGTVVNLSAGPKGGALSVTVTASLNGISKQASSVLTISSPSPGPAPFLSLGLLLLIIAVVIILVAIVVVVVLLGRRKT
jgi:hypothetical protein